jgi:hypothetical protein
MTTAIPLTLHLLVLIGVYELAAGIAGLTGKLDWTALLDDFERSPALTFITGFMVFAVGAAINLAHHHWTDPLAIIVSAVGWIALIEGVMIMVCPGPLLRFSRGLIGNPKLISALAAAIGLILIVIGLTGRADPTYS